jgi:hypothetical protein
MKLALVQSVLFWSVGQKLGYLGIAAADTRDPSGALAVKLRGISRLYIFVLTGILNYKMMQTLEVCCALFGRIVDCRDANDGKEEQRGIVH